MKLGGKDDMYDFIKWYISKHPLGMIILVWVIAILILVAFGDVVRAIALLFTGVIFGTIAGILYLLQEYLKETYNEWKKVKK